MATYYMRADGTAANKAAATGPGSTQSACMNVSVHNGETFSAGDIIKLADDGGVYRAQLSIPSSGSSGNPITYEPESGDAPAINGADLITGWTNTYLVETYGENAGDDNQGVTEDSYIENDNPDTAYDTANLRVKDDVTARKSLISFDLTGLSDTVTNADLYYYSNSSAPIKLWDCSDPFTEAATWNNYDGGSGGWTGTHGQNTLLDTKTFPASLAYLAWDSAALTNFVEANKGARVYFIFWNEGDTTDTWGNSSENGANNPYLEITTGWQNVWSATVTTQPNQVFFDGTRGTKAASIADVNSANKWFWASNVLYVYSTSDPDTAFTSPGIESGARNHAAFLNGQSHITLDGLILEMANATVGSGVWVNGVGATGNTVKNCTIRLNAHGVMIFTTDAQNGAHTIQNNIVHDNYKHGITFNAGTDGSSSGNETLIQGNTVYNNSQFGIFAYTSWSIIESNVVYSNGGTDAEYGGIHVWGGAVGTPTANTGDNNIVRYNVTYNNISGGNDGTGVQLDIYCDDNQVYYNIAYGNDGPGFKIFAAQDNFMYNNVAYDNSQDSSGELTDFAEFRLSTSGSYTNTNSVLKNNIGFATQGGTYAISVATGVTTPTIDSNLWYRTSGDWWNYAGVTGTSLVTWKTKSGVGPNELNADPLFVNAATADFHIQSGSPCRDAGTPVGLTQDFWSNPVPK